LVFPGVMQDATTVEGRIRFVQLQQGLGRRALARGDIEGARAALRALQPGDFDGATVICEICLRVLNDDQSAEGNVHAALKILGRLPIRSA
jgi:hypothetical protein